MKKRTISILVILILIGLGSAGVIYSNIPPALPSERNPLPPRVPLSDLASVKTWVDPFEATPENIQIGKEIFEEKGTCFNCHGLEGKGNGKYVKYLEIGPRNFTNRAWQQARTDGELLWILKNGSPGTDMEAYVPEELTEEEAWYLITYIRAFSGT